jgi:hypothetical protein
MFLVITHKMLNSSNDIIILDPIDQSSSTETSEHGVFAETFETSPA